MSVEAEVATQIVGETFKIMLDGSVAVIKVAGKGAVHGAALLSAALSEKRKSRGKVRLTEMLKEKGGMTLFTLKADELAAFAKSAKKYGIKYCVVKDKKSDGNTLDLFCRALDAPVINRIIEKNNLSAVHQDVQVKNSYARTENDLQSGKDYPEQEYEYGDITISRELNSLVLEENETAIKTRVPKTYGKNIKFLWIDKANLTEVHGGKSYLTHIDPEETYELYGKENQLVEKIKGEDLIKYYDRHDRNKEKEVIMPKAEPKLKTEEEMRPSVREKLNNASKSADEINEQEKETLKTTGKLPERPQDIPPAEKEKRYQKKVNAFNNFHQREYGDDLERKLLAKSGLTAETPVKAPELTEKAR